MITDFIRWVEEPVGFSTAVFCGILLIGILLLGIMAAGTPE